MEMCTQISERKKDVHTNNRKKTENVPTKIRKKKECTHKYQKKREQTLKYQRKENVCTVKHE